MDDPDNLLSNLRFADDVLLRATSSRDVSRMIKDLDSEARKYGVKLHMGKTVIMTNVSARPISVKCGDQYVRVLQGRASRNVFGPEAICGILPRSRA